MNRTPKKEKKKSPLDLNELFPGYFKKSVFRGVIVVMLLFTFFVYQSNDFVLKFEYVECPVSSPGPCEYWDPANVTQINKPYLMEPGEVFGVKPNFWALRYNAFSLYIVYLGLLLNHVLYIFRSKKLGVPFNKGLWKKILKEGKEENGSKNNK